VEPQDSCNDRKRFGGIRKYQLTQSITQQFGLHNRREVADPYACEQRGR
jgi:hypothetical protein